MAVLPAEIEGPPGGSGRLPPLRLLLPLEVFDLTKAALGFRLRRIGAHVAAALGDHAIAVLDLPDHAVCLNGSSPRAWPAPCGCSPVAPVSAPPSACPSRARCGADGP